MRREGLGEVAIGPDGRRCDQICRESDHRNLVVEVARPGVIKVQVPLRFAIRHGRDAWSRTQEFGNRGQVARIVDVNVSDLMVDDCKRGRVAWHKLLAEGPATHS